VTADLLEQVRKKKEIYRLENKRDIIYYHYSDEKVDVVIVAAGYDVFGFQTLRQLLFILLISFIIGVFIAVVSGYVFSKWLLLPLGKIADDVSEISAQSLTRRIDTGRSHDEWYHL